MDWKSIVGTVAPTIAVSLGGPLAGAAMGALAKVLECVPQNAEIAKAMAAASPEVLAAIKKADQEFQIRMSELGLEPEKIEAADRASARERQEKMGDKTPQILAYSYTVVFFTLIVGEIVLAMMKLDIPPGVLRSLDLSTGILFAFVIASKDYFLGSSAGSKSKDELIRHQWDTTS